MENIFELDENTQTKSTWEKIKSIADGGADDYIKIESLRAHCKILIKEVEDLKAIPLSYCCAESAKKIEELTALRESNEKLIYRLEQQTIHLMGKSSFKISENTDLTVVMQKKIDELYEQLNDKSCVGKICVPVIKMPLKKDFLKEEDFTEYIEEYNKFTDEEKSILALQQENESLKRTNCRLLGKSYITKNFYTPTYQELYQKVIELKKKTA